MSRGRVVVVEGSGWKSPSFCLSTKKLKNWPRFCLRPRTGKRWNAPFKPNIGFLQPNIRNLRMETTEIPNTSVIDFTSESPSGATVTNIEDGRLVPSMRESRDLDLPHSRIYFPFVLSLVTRFISALTAGRPSVPIGGNPTLTGGVLPIFVPSQTVTVTVTNTFFVQLCTPSPFPFSECLQFRKRYWVFTPRLSDGTFFV